MSRTNKLLTVAGALLLVAICVYGYYFGIAPESNQVIVQDAQKSELLKSVRQSVGKDALNAMPEVRRPKP